MEEKQKLIKYRVLNLLYFTSSTDYKFKEVNLLIAQGNFAFCMWRHKRKSAYFITDLIKTRMQKNIKYTSSV